MKSCQQKRFVYSSESFCWEIITCGGVCQVFTSEPSPLLRVYVRRHGARWWRADSGARAAGSVADCSSVGERVSVCLSVCLLAICEAGPLVNAREAADNGINMSPITRGLPCNGGFLATASSFFHDLAGQLTNSKSAFFSPERNCFWVVFLRNTKLVLLRTAATGVMIVYKPFINLTQDIL